MSHNLLLSAHPCICLAHRAFASPPARLPCCSSYLLLPIVHHLTIMLPQSLMSSENMCAFFRSIPLCVSASYPTIPIHSPSP
ncbi:hypothetical protein AQUCO_00900968v1 [Aquilegia coerulea]|uniref:Uncharacterized protein n=1 Tax=Aquilegia coerulea TaxID=218851 RepID=A0A2G5EGQ2_AQUCA|nr:hypothetical protein AQUCO_00900968v1 [Aquilegia coerulea]